MVASVLALLKSRDAPRRQKLLAAANIFGIVYSVGLPCVALYWNIFHIIPICYGHSESDVLIHFAVNIFIALNIFGNFINVIRSDSNVDVLSKIHNVKEHELPMECTKCKRGVPRRTHHCPQCDTCVLKRDHHCVFMGSCIGFFNMKYFLMFCFYVSLGGMYSTILTSIYLQILYKVEFSTMMTLITLPPTTLYSWFQTVETTASGQIAVIGIFYGTLCSSLMASGLLLWQIYLTFRGQTSYEAKYGIFKYSRSIRHNLLDVLGPYWFVTVLLPLPLPQSGNGTYLLPKDCLNARKSQSTGGVHGKSKQQIQRDSS